jgi:hypothetical protein
LRDDASVTTGAGSANSVPVYFSAYESASVCDGSDGAMYADPQRGQFASPASNTSWQRRHRTNLGSVP